MPGPLSGVRSSGVRPPAHRRVVSVTDNGSSLARVATVAAHGLATGATVVLSGTPVVAYNGTPDTVTVVDATTFDCDSLAYTADARGGSWSHA